VTSLLPGNCFGGVFRHGVHHSSVVCRLSKQIYVITRTAPLRPETYFSHRSVGCVLRHLLASSFLCGNYEAVVNVSRFRKRAQIGLLTLSCSVVGKQPYLDYSVS